MRARARARARRLPCGGAAGRGGHDALAARRVRACVRACVRQIEAGATVEHTVGITAMRARARAVGVRRSVARWGSENSVTL